MEQLNNKKKIILLPLDGSEDSLKAVIPAKGLALLLDAYIHIIHVSEESLSHKELLKKLKVDPNEFPEFVVNIARGDPGRAILKEAESADFIIMLAYEKNKNKKKVTGSVTQTIIENSDIPVILIRPDMKIIKKDHTWHPGKILLPLDGTPECAHALEASKEIINKTRAEIDVLHIFSSSEKTLGGESLTAPYYEDALQQEWESWSREFMKRYSPKLEKDVKINLYLFRGDPADSIINFSKEKNPDLIILEWKGILSGHHAETLKKIVQQIPCPILLIKITEKQRVSSETANKYTSKSN